MDAGGGDGGRSPLGSPSGVRVYLALRGLEGVVRVVDGGCCRVYFGDLGDFEGREIDDPLSVGGGGGECAGSRVVVTEGPSSGCGFVSTVRFLYGNGGFNIQSRLLNFSRALIF